MHPPQASQTWISALALDLLQLEWPHLQNESDSHFLASWDSGTERVSGVRVPPEALVFLSVSVLAVLLIGPWSGELGAGRGRGVER